MGEKYKKKSNLINNTGYTPGYATEKNPVNYIPSENITMANTPYPLKATPLDEYGNPIGQSIIMSPGGEYRFKGASYVEERPVFQRGGRSKVAPSLERQLLNKYVDPAKNRAMERAKSQGIRTGIHNGGLDAIRHSSSAAATSSILPSWANAIPGVLPANIAMTNLAGIAHEVNSPNSFKEHASDLYNNFVGSVVGVLPVSEETKHNLLISAQKNGILSDMGNKKPLNKKVTPSKQNSMNNTTSPTFNRNVSSKKPFTRTLPGNLPGFGKGGEKNDWISSKISTLVKEGYPQKQAVAIAYSMYENQHGNGGYQLPKYQVGKNSYSFGNTFAGSNFGKPKFGADPNIQSPEAFSASLDKITEVNPGEYGLGKDPNKPSLLSPESLTAGKDWAAKNPLPQGIEKPMSTNVFGAEVEDSKPKTETTGLEKPNIEGNQPFQFFNPYSGVDIPTAGVMFGQSLENKDTLGAIASGAKVALGTARNILGGMGQARRENYVKKQYAEKQREGMTGQGREQMARFGGYYQEGGMQPEMEQDMEQQGAGQEQQMMQEVAQMLQQGADPQQVIQQLVQMGIPQDQAVQMVQAIMQQMQGSTPQLKRGGMMYYQDGGEDEEDGEDDYEYEEEPNYIINKPSLMGKRQNFSEPALAISPAIESAVEATSPTEEEEETPKYDKSSARDTWVAKTGMPWSEAKRLGYTSGSAKDNMKLLSELNDSRFDKKYLRKKPLSPAKKEAEDNKTYFGGVLKEVVITAPKKKKGASRFMFTSDKAYQDYLKANNIKAPAQNNGLLIQAPAFDFSPKQKEQPMFRQAYQDGGEQQVAQQAAQALQQGAQPEQVMQMLLESGMTQDQAVQLVQAIMQQVQQQGGMEEGTPQMRRGGEMIRRKDGSYSRRGLWDNIRDNRGSGKAPTREMLEQEAKIKGNKKEMGGYMYEDGGINNPGFRALPEYVQDKIMSNMYQEGGMEPEADPTEAIMQQVAQMLQQGAQPEEILQMLVEAGVPEDQATQMVQAVMQQMQEPQGTPQMRDGGIPERYKKMGFTKVGAKKQSTSEGKKWMVLAKKGDQYKVVHGGDDSMKDFSQHGSEDRKENFWNRMGGRDSAKANDPFSPLYWHKKFGTWQEGGEMMDEQMEGENEGMENESAMLEQIESQVEEALKQGADPEEVLQQLIQMGVPEDQAVEMIQEILDEIQGGETESEAPEMKDGGSYLNALKGKTIKDYTFNSKTGKYEVSYE
jgi:transcriptional regulator CtsR